MVMRKNMMTRNLTQSIRKSLGRYIAISLIIALGAGMYIGLNSTKMDMVATGQVYTDEQEMFDLRLITSVGWGKEQAAQAAELEGVSAAEGMFYTDLILNPEGESEGSVYRVYTIPEMIDRPVLLSGRMPQAANECLADGFYSKDPLGAVLDVSEDNSEDAIEQLNFGSFTVVGTVSTPLYMDMNRGNTSIGSGKIDRYLLVPQGAFDVDYDTEIHVSIPGQYSIYSKEYNDAMSAAADALKPSLEPMAEARMEQVKRDAMQAYRDGQKEYADGLSDYRREKKDAETKLEDARLELEDAAQTIRDSEKQIQDGEEKIRDGWAAWSKGKAELKQAKEQLAQSKANAPAQIRDAAGSFVSELSSLNSRRASLRQEQIRLSGELAQANAYIRSIESGAVEADDSEKAAAYARRDRLESELGSVNVEYEKADNRVNELMAGIPASVEQLLSMSGQLREAEQKIQAAETKLNHAEGTLRYQQAELKKGKQELEDGKKEYADGLREYENARREADEKFAEAEEALADAKQKLADAWQKIQDLKEPNLMVLDRTTNMGYVSLDSSSDIVAGVSRVFPVFFILVAALVCITTMTRMVEDERTQIGTLKALGYSNGAIMSKYLIYAGSSSVIGSLLGVLWGSTLFPTVLWEAYKIMIFITPTIVLKFNVMMAVVVTLSYTGAMLLVTWYCCRRALEEVPAELIRPRPPEAGKKLLMERLPFWDGISFLNKVALRNIFRYRQRLAMMLLGIGGCTALLMTGFGLQDSISKIVDVQFREVTTYDLSVNFREGCDAEAEDEFRNAMAPYARDVLFFNQISCDISTDEQTRSIYLISAGDELPDFWNLYSDGKPMALPGVNEVLLSAGICDLMQISQGDSIIIRNPDMEELHLTVSGIYDNHVHNYAIIHPETVEAQWGRTPEKQMAFLNVQEGKDPGAAGAAAAERYNVLNVTVSEQMAQSVGTMMKALDLVVLVVVFCAALLAIIVLYNLTNINITERIREIATIKVLGFNARETGMYVFKENLVLTAMGTVLGIPMGMLLLKFVISQIRIDMIWLKARLEWPSLVISIVFTLCMALVVDLIFYYKLDKINMAEALKSVE